MKHYPISPRQPALSRQCRALFAHGLLSSSRWSVEGIARQVEALLASGAHYFAVHLDTITLLHAAPTLRERLAMHDQNVPIIGSINDSFSLYRGDVCTPRAISPLVRAVASRAERRLLPTADLIDVIGERDLEWLRARIPSVRVRLVPPIRPVDDHFRTPGNYDDRYYDVAFIADRRRTEQLLRPVVGKLRATDEVRVTLIGSRATEAQRQFVRSRGGSAPGFVPNLQDVLGRSRIVVAPSRQRAGVSFRTIDAMAAGAVVVGGRCVGTIPGARRDENYLSARSASELCIQIRRALDNRPLWEDLSRRGQWLVRGLPTASQVATLYESIG